jgi:N-methylhydantoinase B
MAIDFEGTSPTVARGINCVANYSRAYAVHAVKSAICPDLPSNQGVFAQIAFSIPEGSILNSRRPAPVSARHLTGHFASFAVYGALARAIPERVIADSSGPCGGTLQITGSDAHGVQFSVLAFNSGGLGARPAQDGTEATHFPANAANTPIEVLEAVAPILFERKELLPDSGGPGKFRGGCGQRLTFRLQPGAAGRVALMFERIRYPARGFAGGKPGSASRIAINGQFLANAKHTVALNGGDVVSMDLAGGGGYYPPDERDPLAVLTDVREGKITAQQARDAYCVALTDDRQAIDAPKTAALRAARQQEAARD